ncbi:hypothetical protein GPA10_37010 [Streptomyces sp. p1417]|uniref:Uncharacterized protein n=1 Tax=Streptomyces typhae TaxID=2681492 RepID=A0A6L6X938_9ACTN|nr:hypothetical protein [Streptomyces typhae]MVO90207.1 hypothetical protein [Streptomyces typhae]
MEKPPPPPQQPTGHASPDQVQTSRQTIERSRSLINGIQANLSKSRQRIQHSRQRVHRSRQLLTLTPEPTTEPAADHDETHPGADEPDGPCP